MVISHSPAFAFTLLVSNWLKSVTFKRLQGFQTECMLKIRSSTKVAAQVTLAHAGWQNERSTFTERLRSFSISVCSSSCVLEQFKMQHDFECLYRLSWLPWHRLLQLHISAVSLSHPALLRDHVCFAYYVCRRRRTKGGQTEEPGGKRKEGDARKGGVFLSRRSGQCFGSR